MSSSLKDRLKRCGRYHPATPPTKKEHNENVKPDVQKSPKVSEDSDLCSNPFEMSSPPPSAKTIYSRSSQMTTYSTPNSKIFHHIKRRGLELGNNNHERENILKTNNINTSTDFVTDRDRLLQDVSEKEEKLRKLEMVKMYRKKNDLEQLHKLINKWRSVSQEALQDLHTMLPEPKPTLTDLIHHLGIDFELVKYNIEDENFYF